MTISQFPIPAGGIPTGNTAGRPASPVIGDVYYNGEKAILEIYEGTNWVPCSAPPASPTIAVADVGTSAAYGSAQGLVTITEGIFGGPADQFLISASTGGYQATTTGTTVTITVGNNGSYIFSGQGQNNFGTSLSGPTTTATLTTVPQAPTIGTATDAGVVTWTLNNNGGKNLTSITITPYLNGTTAQTATTAATTTATSATITTGITEGSTYTFKVKATNANGDSLESSASNSVTINKEIAVDYLVVAGGGAGGGANNSGGGGAGGLRSTVTNTGGGGSLESALTITKGTNYTVTVGAGGAGGGTNPGNNGSDSVFSTITSTGGGGGRGGDANNTVGSSGGSGGGSNYATSTGTPGAGTANQGYAGGLGSGNIPDYSAGGGGGAGAVGVNGTTTAGGNGGAGVAVSITGSSVTRGGGGGGMSNAATKGAGGTGGGGAGGAGGNAVAGTVNTGGGGGGSSSSGAGGGSGIVILRWLTTDGTITVGAGLTADATGTDGSHSYKVFTAGSGNVSWS